MGDFSRRRFLAASSVFAVPNLLRAAEVKPSERLTLGFIGLGRMGRSHIVNNFCKRKNVHGLAVCDVDTTRRDWSKGALGQLNAKVHKSEKNDVATYNDYRELLARDDIDAVVIATPDHWHAKVAMDALAAGKDVYCEKPLTHTLDECKVLMAEVKKQGRVLQTGSMQRSYMPEFRVGCELVVNGVIGDVKEVHVSFGGPPNVECDLPEEKMEPGLDWERWIGPAKMRAYNTDLCPRGVQDVSPNWRGFWEYGGGSVMDFGAHHVDIARWGMLLDDEMPVEVRLDEKKSRSVGAQLVFANGVTIKHVSSKASIEFFGETGRVRLGRRRFELWRGDGAKDYEFISANQVNLAHEKYLAGDDVKMLYRCTDHHGDFVDAVKNRTRPICNEDVGGRTAMSCHLLNIAYRYGRDLQWDAERNVFAEGGGDPAWLGRESYREGYGFPG